MFDLCTYVDDFNPCWAVPHTFCTRYDETCDSHALEPNPNGLDDRDAIWRSEAPG